MELNGLLRRGLIFLFVLLQGDYLYSRRPPETRRNAARLHYLNFPFYPWLQNPKTRWRHPQERALIPKPSPRRCPPKPYVLNNKFSTLRTCDTQVVAFPAYNYRFLSDKHQLVFFLGAIRQKPQFSIFYRREQKPMHYLRQGAPETIEADPNTFRMDAESGSIIWSGEPSIYRSTQIFEIELIGKLFRNSCDWNDTITVSVVCDRSDELPVQAPVSNLVSSSPASTLRRLTTKLSQRIVNPVQRPTYPNSLSFLIPFFDRIFGRRRAVKPTTKFYPITFPTTSPLPPVTMTTQRPTRKYTPIDGRRKVKTSNNLVDRINYYDPPPEPPNPLKVLITGFLSGWRTGLSRKWALG